MPSYSRALSDALKIGVQLIPVLTIDAQGTEYHLSPKAFRVPRADDTHILIRGGLIDVPQLPIIKGSIRDASIDVSGVASIVVSTVFLDWTDHLMARIPIQSMRAELSLMPESGANWEDRIVLYHGMIRSPSWDMRLREVGFNITNESPDTVLLVPRQLVSVDTISTAPERAIGEPYPILYGRDVYDVAGIVIKESVDDNRILIAGHHIDPTASLQVLTRESGDVVNSLPVTAINGLDDAGNPIAYLVLADTAYWEDTPSNSKPWTFYFQASGKRGHGGVVANDSLEFYLLGEVMLDLLIHYSGLSLDRIDASSFHEVDALFPIEVSVQITEQKTVLEWLTELTDGLPITVAWISGKLTAKVGAFTINPDDVVADLRYGHELIELLRRYEETPVEEVVNTAYVRYDFRNRKDRWAGIVQLDRDNDPVAKISQDRHGRREQQSALDLWQLRDDASALRVAHERMARFSQVAVRCAYLVQTEHAAHLLPFDIVRVTDEAQGVTEELFVIEEIAPQVDDRMIIGMRSRKELTRG